jgi:hypothetical protein
MQHQPPASIRKPLKSIIRAHRIHIDDIPSLFSEGVEPEPLQRPAWLPHATIARSLMQAMQRSLQNLARLPIGGTAPQSKQHANSIN